MRPARGVTLVELVTVIVLTLVLTSVAIGGLVGMRTWRRAAAVRRIHADVLYARHLAMLSSRRTLCVFDTASQTYELRQEAAPASGVVAATVIEHPTSAGPWTVALADLAGDLRVVSVVGVSAATLGFGADGLPIESSGAWVGQDVRIDFDNGAAIEVRRGSGFAEVIWP
jgi:Tfp pilus assembly protein FimT